jgi:hypothetical protein
MTRRSYPCSIAYAINRLEISDRFRYSIASSFGEYVQITIGSILCEP